MSMLQPDFAELDDALTQLGTTVSKFSPTSGRAKFFVGQITENLRVAFSFRSLVPICIADARSSVEAFEVVARLCFERTILISYCHKLEGDEPLNRFEKTNDWSAKRVWKDDYTETHSESPASQLPDYRKMCESADAKGDMLRIFQQLSHIAHPRSSVPAFVSETTSAATGSDSADGLRLKRAQAAINVVAHSVRLTQAIAAAEFVRL